MKKSTAIALGAASIGAYLLLRKRDGAEGAGGDGSGLPFKEGTFDPKNAAQMPDFAEVLGDISEGEEDWMRWCAAPGYDRVGGIATAPIDLVAEYRRKLWEPASRISIDTLTVGDFERAAYFMAGAWGQGVSVGCPTTIPDKIFGDVSGRLEQDASGLEIGAQIGTGLASVFGYGQAAQASDKAFGFGRGAQELRDVKISIESLPASFRVDLAALDMDAVVRPDPAGTPQGANVAYDWRNEPIACLANLFSASFQLWDPGNSGFGIEDFIAARAGTDMRKGSFRYQNPETMEWEVVNSTDVALYALTDVKLNDERRVDSATVYLRRGWNNPWWSREMGCALSHRERVYVRARMYRTVDLIHALLMPSDARVAVHDAGKAESFRVFEDGSVGERYDGRYVTFSYKSTRFGSVRGSIFPAKSGDAVMGDKTLDSVANYVPFGGTDLPDMPVTPEENRISAVSTVPVAAVPTTPEENRTTTQSTVATSPDMTSTSAGAPVSSPTGSTFRVSRFAGIRVV